MFCVKKKPFGQRIKSIKPFSFGTVKSDANLKPFYCRPLLKHHSSFFPHGICVCLLCAATAIEQVAVRLLGFMLNSRFAMANKQNLLSNGGFNYFIFSNDNSLVFMWMANVSVRAGVCVWMCVWMNLDCLESRRAYHYKFSPHIR